MKLYDGFISQINGLINGRRALTAEYSPSSLENAGKNNVLFLKDTAFELGGSGEKCVSTLAVTSSFKYSNRIRLLGGDIKDIKSDCPFAKIVLLEIEEIDEETAFEKIRRLEQIRYNFCPRGFMSRASAISMREQIRVGKKTVKDKISLVDYAKFMLGEYLKDSIVKSAEIILVTDRSFDYDGLISVSEKIKDTTSALNHILDNVLFDCKSCNLKEICDEVEGMKELHMKTVNQKR